MISQHSRQLKVVRPKTGSCKNNSNAYLLRKRRSQDRVLKWYCNSDQGLDISFRLDDSDKVPRVMDKNTNSTTTAGGAYLNLSRVYTHTYTFICTCTDALAFVYILKDRLNPPAGMVSC